MQFSHRTGPRQPNRIALAEAAAVNRGVNLLRLNDSNPTQQGLGLEQLGVYQAEPRGPLAARCLLADYVQGRGGQVSPDNLYLVSSTSQAYSWLMKLLCDPGDIVLEPRPGYPLIESLAQLECVQTRQYQLVYDGSWTVDLAYLHDLFTGPDAERIRALVLINPNNPTGSYIHSQERSQILNWCREFGVAVIADEVFFDYPLDPLPGRQRLAGDMGQLTFALDGFSKMLAAPQAKLGWIQVSGPPDQLAEACSRLDTIADAYLPVSQLIVSELANLLAAVPQQHERVSQRIGANLVSLRQWLGQPGCLLSLLRPEGGWNVLLRFPAVVDENTLCEALIRDFARTGQPGYFFDMPSNGYLALSLLPEPQVFADNLAALDTALAGILTGEE